MFVSRRYQKYIVVFSITLAMLWSILCPAFDGNAYAATPRLDQIRVALFIQTRDMAPAVTLSATSAAQIGVRSPSGIRAWLNVDSGTPVRFSVDQYRVLMYESLDLSIAKTVASQLSSVMNARERAFVFGVQRGGTTVYQVVAGNYMNVQEAVAAKDKFLANAVVSSSIAGFMVQVKGPHHLTAGSFVNEGEAQALQVRYQDIGIDAEIVYHENADQQLVYSVWLGDESSPEQLDSIQFLAQVFVPEQELAAIDTSIPYLYKRVDYTGTTPIAHYYYNPNNHKVWFSADSPGIRVQERSNRTYRGSMELSQYNGRLALINELPFEQYLYAVVSNEMGGGFPPEALKAQAVAARTYALQQGMKYGIAHISDTVYDQAYYGYGSEASAAIQAVDATASEVVVSSSDYSLITPFYSSNSGGFTSETDEVWGTAVSYLQSVPSPDDVAEQGRHTWYRVVLRSGQIGYVRHDLVTISGFTSAGLAEVMVLDNHTNIRPSPDTSGTPITQVHEGDRLIIVETVIESNPYSWISEQWRSGELLTRINQYVRNPITGDLRSLEVAARGMSGRVISVVANGSQKLDVSYPDAYRTVFNGLRSTRFDIEQTNDLTILSANGITTNVKTMSGQDQLYVLSGHATIPSPASGEYLYAMNRDQEVRVGTFDPQYRFIGRGYGHGLGMSQYGAKALAELGYDYKRILQYYYKNVQIIKG